MAGDDDETNASGTATEGMAGEGRYDANSAAQSEGLRRQETRLRRAARRLDVTGAELRVMDYGCRPGHNSVAAVGLVIGELRAAGVATPVVAVHGDQIGNAWSDFFARLSDAGSCLQAAKDVRVEVSVGSSFGAVASEGALDLAMCFAAAHWLSGPVRTPSPVALFFCGLPEPARGEITARAARD